MHLHTRTTNHAHTHSLSHTHTCTSSLILFCLILSSPSFLMFHSSLCQERLQTMIGTRTKPRRSLKIILEGNPIFSPENMDRKEKNSSNSSNRSFGLFYFKGPVWMENFFSLSLLSKVASHLRSFVPPKAGQNTLFSNWVWSNQNEKFFSYQFIFSLSLSLTHTHTH